jgi:glycosyltransferase involved in cell wall biosynthesis
MHPQWDAMIIGSNASSLPKLFSDLISKSEDRIAFVDRILPEQLVAHFNASSIAFWASRWEGQQATGAQALCCGCSVVAPFSGEMSCFRHYISRESGRLAGHNHVQALATELSLEAASWEAGERDPRRISEIWKHEFHACNVAAKALYMLGLDPRRSFLAASSTVTNSQLEPIPKPRKHNLFDDDGCHSEL